MYKHTTASKFVVVLFLIVYVHTVRCVIFDQKTLHTQSVLEMKFSLSISRNNVHQFFFPCVAEYEVQSHNTMKAGFREGGQEVADDSPKNPLFCFPGSISSQENLFCRHRKFNCKDIIS